MVLASDSAQKIVRWIIFGLSILAFVFAIVVVSHCSFIEEDLDFTEVGLGLFSGQTNGDSCESYDDEDIDFLGSPFKAARAFGVLATLAVSFAMILVASIQLFLSSKKVKGGLWIAVRVLFAIAFFCNLLTFTAFASDVCDDIDCGLGAAGGLAVANTFLLLTLSILSCFVSPPEEPVIPCSCAGGDEEAAQATGRTYQKNRKEQAETGTKVTVVEKPDGTKIITKEVTHPDGSKTITETVESME